MQVKDRVIILKKTRYGDADLILNCLNPKGQRLSLFARSALKSKKRFGGGVLEPMHYIHVIYEDKSTRGGSDQLLHTLKEASIIEGFDGLRTDYSRIETGLYLVRLISDVVQEGTEESSELFNLLGNTLRAAQTSKRLDLLRIHFEIKLLANQGILELEPEEETLMHASIADHETIQLTDGEWLRVKSKARRSLLEYVGRMLPAL